jgi:hypothetical protein
MEEQTTTEEEFTHLHRTDNNNLPKLYPHCSLNIGRPFMSWL